LELKLFQSLELGTQTFPKFRTLEKFLDATCPIFGTLEKLTAWKNF
jgi:hypothetical protein